jgi:hypothetical protein
MALGKSKVVGTGYAIWIALALFLFASIGFPLGVAYVFGPDMKVEHKLTLAQLTVSLLGFGGAIAAFLFAFVQYRRSEQWKRAEFIANEVKDFESDPVVQNALLMIDWGNRRINLFLNSDLTGAGFAKITREVQWRALLPHPIKQKYLEYRTTEDLDSEKNVEQKSTFTFVEAKIRDTYDVYLTRLDRFASFIKSGLISSEELGPFINYWVDAMTKNEQPDHDATWRCTLLTYINYYDYTGVKYLLECYGKDVSPEGSIYSDVSNSMQDRTLAERLAQIIASR